MDIVHVRNHKKAWLPLLLVGDESEAMIDRYLERGDCSSFMTPMPGGFAS